MKLILSDAVQLTVRKKDLDRALRPHGYKIVNNELKPRRNEDKPLDNPDLYSKTMWQGTAMPMIDALCEIIPVALAFLIEEMSVSPWISKNVPKHRFRAKDFQAYIRTHHGLSVLGTHIPNAVNGGRLLAAMARETPLLGRTASNGTYYYTWNPPIWLEETDPDWPEGSDRPLRADKQSEEHIAQWCVFNNQQYRTNVYNTVYEETVEEISDVKKEWKKGVDPTL